MKRAGLVFACMLSAVVATPLFAQQATIQHDAVSCVKASEFPMLIADVRTAPGKPRAFYRIRGSEDWCWVDGARMGNKAHFMLPKFQDEVQLEYYFITYEDDLIKARSPRVYVAPVAQSCGLENSTRHVEVVLTNCDATGLNLGSVVGAGLLLGDPKVLEPESPSTPAE